MPTADLAEFSKLYYPENRPKRTETRSEQNLEEHWRKFTYEAIPAPPEQPARPRYSGE